MRHDERTIRNVDDEIYRIAPRTHGSGAGRIDAREEYARDLREKDYLRAQMNRLANGGQPMPMMDPAMMPPPMLPAPGPAPEAQVQVAENAAAQQGEALGQEYLDEMMTGIDTADSTEELIDAMRGDDRTLQERYDELANFVGERDASATPESVLTLVQPTIMMTEQGAMDSGIGELMQGISGEVDMETEMGVPTPMGQGIGELMMSQSVEEVIPEMNAGGPVQRFANGGTPDLSNILNQYQALTAPSTADEFGSMVDARMPIYQRLLGDTDQTKQDLQSKLYFDIAQAGLNLASGTDPRTGQSMAGKPLASQLASAAQPVVASAGAGARELRNIERGAAAGALQSAEAAEAARIGAARGIQSDMFRGAGALASQVEGLRFTGRENELNRRFQRTEGESDRQLQERLATERNSLTERLFDKDTTRRIEEILKRGGVEIDLINERGEVETGLIDDRMVAQLKRDGQLNEFELGQIEARKIAEGDLIGLRGLEQRASMRLDLQKRADLQDDEQLHQLEMQRERIAQGESEFTRQLDRLLANDEFAEELGRDQFTELVRQREALRGGERGIINAVANSVLGIDTGFGVGTTAFDIAREAQKFGFNIQEESLQLKQEEASFMQRFREANRKLSEELARAKVENESVDLGIRGYQAGTDRIEAIQSLQTDYSKLFGGSQEGIMRGVLSNTDALDRFGRGLSSPSEAQQIIQSIEVLSRPSRVFDPSTGMSTYSNPSLPSAVVEAARLYEQNVGPMFAQGGAVVKMAEGGDPQMTAFQKRMMEQPRSALEPTPPPEGFIVDETLSFEDATGPISGLKRVLNVGAETGREFGLPTSAPFIEVDQASEQLRAVSNMTQRFIRNSSTSGRPLAIEIQALAEEIAQPGAFKMDETTLVKLQTMRNQLQEVQSLATSVLEAPQAYNQKVIIGAREDLTSLTPLLDNYNKIIKSYEIGLGKLDKPDPSMFERGLGNAQGNVGQALLSRRMLPLPGMEDRSFEESSLRSAILASQGGPINRRRS